MVNHLYRSREGRRHQQATMLNEWARNQTVPIIAVGDYNFDWDIEDGENDHDAGYDNMTKDGVFSWLRPDELIKTQCSPRYNSVLDFIFLSGSAQTWSGTSFIDEVRPDYCSTQGDDESDHRPVFAFIDPSETVEVVPASVDIFSSNSSGDSQSSPNYMLHAVSEDVAWKIDTRTGKLQRCVYVPQGNRVRCTQ